MKYLFITFDNGEVWRVDPNPLMKKRAEYYVDRDIQRGDTAIGKRDAEIESEIEFAMNDEYEVKGIEG